MLVVGGGLTGLTAAFLLKQAGKSVAVVERARLGAIDTGQTTAHLTMVTDARLHELTSHFGRDHAGAAWDAGAAAIDQIESIVTSEGIDCQFRRVPGFLHAADGRAREEEKTLREDASLAQEFGFSATYREAVPFFDVPGVQFSDQALFHPLRYLHGLAQKVAGDGSHVFEESEAGEFDAGNNRVEVNGHFVKHDRVIIATHNPLVGYAGMAAATLFQTKLALYTSYAVGATIPRGRLPIASFWDTADPYNYLRVHPGDGHDIAIYGGADHKTGQVSETETCFAAIEKRLHGFLPEAAITHRWSGQVITTNDGLPFIGENAERQFIATGFAGNGMTFGTVAGMMARDWVMGTRNPWSDLFAPDRKKIRGGTWDYLRENVDYPYYLVKGHLQKAEAESVREIKPGEGRIIRENGARIAACRDQDGGLHKRSAICPHMGCVVRWNQAESTWDCPCHGSRFKPDGDVISGPAESPLAKP